MAMMCKRYVDSAEGHVFSFTAERHIDRIQLSIKARHMRSIIDKFASKIPRTNKYDASKDRMITLFRDDSLKVEVVEYGAKNATDPRKKMWCSVRLQDPRIDSQLYLINNILHGIPQEDRSLKCVEFALDITPSDPGRIRDLHRFIAQHITLNRCRPALVREEENSFTFNPYNRDNVQLITYLIPKDSASESIRLELRLYREHLLRRYSRYLSFNSPIEQFVSPLSPSYVTFRDPLIDDPFPMKRKSISKLTTLRSKIVSGLKLTRVQTIPEEWCVQNQVAMFRHAVKSLGIKHRDVNRYFPKRPDILEGLRNGCLRF